MHNIYNISFEQFTFKTDVFNQHIDISDNIIPYIDMCMILRLINYKNKYTKCLLIDNHNHKSLENTLIKYFNVQIFNTIDIVQNKDDNFDLVISLNNDNYNDILTKSQKIFNILYNNGLVIWHYTDQQIIKKALSQLNTKSDIIFIDNIHIAFLNNIYDS